MQNISIVWRFFFIQDTEILSAECLCQVCVDRSCPELRTNLALGFVQDAGFSKCKGGRSGDRISTAIQVSSKGERTIKIMITKHHVIKLVENKCSREGGWLRHIETCNKPGSHSHLVTYSITTLMFFEPCPGKFGWAWMGAVDVWKMDPVALASARCGHPERNWAPLEWSSLSAVHHDLLELLPNLDCAVSWNLSFILLSTLNILSVEMGEGVEIEWKEISVGLSCQMLSQFSSLGLLLCLPSQGAKTRARARARAAKLLRVMVGGTLRIFLGGMRKLSDLWLGSTINWLNVWVHSHVTSVFHHMCSCQVMEHPEFMRVLTMILSRPASVVRTLAKTYIMPYFNC